MRFFNLNNLKKLSEREFYQLDKSNRNFATYSDIYLPSSLEYSVKNKKMSRGKNTQQLCWLPRLNIFIYFSIKRYKSRGMGEQGIFLVISCMFMNFPYILQFRCKFTQHFSFNVEGKKRKERKKH